MKERPILFSGPMIRAILDGTKTQTRRVVKKINPFANRIEAADFATVFPGATPKEIEREGGQIWTVHGPVCTTKQQPECRYTWFRCPYGQPSDRLWVKETFQYLRPWHQGYELCDKDDPKMEVRFAATEEKFCPELPWRPSIHMRRIDSRIMLEIEAVRVERLQDITDNDAQAEGIFLNRYDWWECGNGLRGESTPVTAYRALWETINGPGSWAANPFCWVINFKRIKP